MISKANFETFNWLMLTCYLVTQGISGSLSSLIAYHVWKMGAKPAILIGLATSLSNHMLFILPIAQNIFTGYIVYQITAIIIVDTLVVGLIVILILESLSSDRLSIAVIGLKLLNNPPVIGVITGLLIALLALELLLFIIKFIQFATYAAAPTALFSLGIVMSHTQVKNQLAFATSISCVKVLLQPMCSC